MIYVTDVNAFLYVYADTYANVLKYSEKEPWAHLHIHIPFLSSFCFTLTYTHTNNAGTAWNKQSMLGFFVHRIHGRMLEKTFIKGFNTSRVFSWRICFWTNTYTGDIYAYGAKANIYTFLPSYHMLSLHSSTPTNKVSVNNQTHPSIHPSYLS